MVDTIENMYGFNDSNILNQTEESTESEVSMESKISIGSRGSQTSECEKLSYFISLITTPKYKDEQDSKMYYDKEEDLNSSMILDYMKSSGFCKSISRLINNCHDCVGINITDIRLDVIEMLRLNGHINMSRKVHTFNVVDILYTLFCEFNTNPEFCTRNYEYINYFWIWIENENPKMIVDYINPQTSAHLIQAIIQSPNQIVRDEFFDLFLAQWNHFYPSYELPTTIIHNEMVDGDNIILILARNFMGCKLKTIFERDSYSSSNYTWYQYYKLNNTTFTVPLIPFLLEENSWMRTNKDLTKLAEIIKILIEYGKIDYSLTVIETGNNLQDYLNYYGYNYENSPVMDVILSYNKIDNATNIPLNAYQYSFNETMPYDYIQYKYEFTKDPTMGKKIFEEILEEEKKTNVPYSNFLSSSGLSILCLSN